MSVDAAPASEESLAPIAQEITLNTEATSPRALADLLAEHRRKDDTAAPEEPAAAEPESAAPAEEATGEATEEAQPEEIPPIEPPRSWTKEEKEEFQSYPREAQEKIARREQERETALRRGQNETAEQRKTLEAQKAKLDDLIGKYEAELPRQLSWLQQQQMKDFADIKTEEDVLRLAREDWPRWSQYQAQREIINAKTQELQHAQARQQEEFKTKWNEFSSAEDRKFLEAEPEMGNKDRATKIADASVSLLKDYGFSESDLSKLWNGEASVSLRDSRIQRILLKAVKHDEALAAAKTKVAAKPIPPVQKPGTSRSRASDDDVQIKNLNNRLNESGNWKDAADLIQARRAARR